MKIYTKTGDEGKTSLLTGKRVSKAHNQVELFGLLDEVNSNIGLMLSVNLPEKSIITKEDFFMLQKTLFVMGSWLATEQEKRDTINLPQVDNSQVGELERHIDKMNEVLPSLKSFILPGGSQLAANCHVCRTMIRRFERNLAYYLDQNKDPDFSRFLVFMNRLSDFFFVFARYANYLEGVEEVKWP